MFFNFHLNFHDLYSEQFLCENNLDDLYSEQFLWENSEQFYLIKKTDFMNAISKFKYTVNMMCREQILLT